MTRPLSLPVLDRIDAAIAASEQTRSTFAATPAPPPCTCTMYCRPRGVTGGLSPTRVMQVGRAPVPDIPPQPARGFLQRWFNWR